MSRYTDGWKNPVPLVYVVEADHGVKVGITVGPIDQRIAELKRATGLPIMLVRTYRCESRRQAYDVEQAAHYRLRETRSTGEWFQCHPFEATAAVELSIRKGTLACVLREYDENPGFRAYIQNLRAAS